MKQLFSPSSFLLAVIALPTQSRDQWELEKYRRIPANEVSFSPQGIRIQVRNSASPLMYPLAQTATISRFKVSGEFFGLPRLTDPSRQGEKGADDYVLRLGLIVPGSKQLGGLQKLLAPSWIKNLYEKMPKGMGLEHVLFFNVTQNPAQLNSARVHPGSDLIREEFIEVALKPGPFQIEHTLKSPTSAVAVWISSDGDDTQSSYDVLVSNLEFVTAP